MVKKAVSVLLIVATLFCMCTVFASAKEAGGMIK